MGFFFFFSFFFSLPLPLTLLPFHALPNLEIEERGGAGRLLLEGTERDGKGLGEGTRTDRQPGRRGQECGGERACEPEWGREVGVGKWRRERYGPAGRTEGSESLDVPRRAVPGAGFLEGMGGWVSARALSYSREGPAAQRSSAGCGIGEKPGGKADGWASAPGCWVEGGVDTFNVHFCLK